MLEFDFRLCPVDLTVDATIRAIDQTLGDLGLLRAVSMQEIEVDDGVPDVAVNRESRVDDLQKAEEVAAKWQGRTHLYRYPTAESSADLNLYVWRQHERTHVVVGLDRGEVRQLINDGADPFVTLGSLLSAIAKATGAGWGVMAVDEDLGALRDEGLDALVEAVGQGSADPSVAWVDAATFKARGVAELFGDHHRGVQTIDGYYVLLHIEATENLAGMCR